MKTLLFIITCLLFIPLNLFSQTIDTAISEGQQFKFCGKIIVLDGIWIDKGIMKADISILNNERSKPITGGYRIMDTVNINDSCILYVNDIEKQGFNTTVNGGYDNTSSRVRLSARPNIYTDTNQCPDYPVFQKNKTYILISFKLFHWTFEKTNMIGSPYVRIKEKAGDEWRYIVLKEKDLLWWQTCLYELVTITKDSLIFKKRNSYFYSENK